MKNKIAGIYMIHNILTDKVYVGQSKNITDRWNKHITTLKNNQHHNNYLQNAYNKYGLINFQFKILEQCEICDLIHKEDYWIKQFQESQLYNLDGVPSSPYNKHTRKIYQIECDTLKPIKLWTSLKEVKLHFSGKDIGGGLNTALKTRCKYYNYYWIYEHEIDILSDIEFIYQGSWHAIKIIQKDMSGKVIKIWKNAKEVHKALNIQNNGTILHIARTNKIYRNFIWEIYA